MNGYWMDGRFILASTTQDKIAGFESETIRLREENANLRKLLDETSKSCAYEAQQWAKWSDEKRTLIASLQSKIDVLRTAIINIDSYSEAYSGSGYVHRQARMALAKTEP